MRVTVSVRSDVQLDPSEVEKAFTAHLEMLCGGPRTFIRDGKLFYWDDTGHGSGLDVEMGRADLVQAAAHELRSQLEKARIDGLKKMEKRIKSK